MIVNSYANINATSGYYKEHNKYSKFKNDRVILIEFRALQHLNDILQDSLTSTEKSEINNGYKLLLLNCSTEADYTFNKLKNFVNLNENHVKVLSASPDIIHDELYIHFEKLSQTTLDINPVSSLLKNPSKLYVNFNFKIRPHRLATILSLNKYNLLDLGYNSFYCKTNDWEYQLSNTKNYFNIDTSFPTSKLPLVLDSFDTNKNAAHIKFSQIEKYMSDSLISLVTETNYFNNEPRFLTEKTFKPIAFKQPFILVTVPKTLEFLKSLGYKTFHGIIDESYDNELDDEKRLEMIMSELKRLSQLTVNELNDFKINCLNIVNHNFELFKNKKLFIH